MPDIIIIEDEEKKENIVEEIKEDVLENPTISTTEAVDLALRQQEDRTEAEAVQENIQQEILWTGERIGWLESSIMDTNIRLDTLIALLTPKEDEIMPEEEKPIVIEEEKKPEEKPEEKKSEETPVESSEKKKKRFWI